MKALLALLAVAVFPFSVFAAQMDWSAGGYGSYGSWTSYLFEVSDGIDTKMIYEYIEENGLQSPGEDSGVTHIDSIVNIEDAGAWIAEQQNLTGTFTEEQRFFVLVVNEAGTEFLLSAIESATTDPNGQIWTLTFNTNYNEWAEDYWQIGSVGGGEEPVDPNVPEPTALALLALGVAGVALRRRVA